MPIFNVKASPFLAVGDGMVDDTLALRAAVAAALASVHGAADPAVVVFPPGAYRLTRDSSTPAGLRTLASIEVRGARDVELRAQAPGAATLLKHGNANAGDWYALRLSGCGRIRVHGLVFDGSKESNPDPAEQAHLVQIDGGCSDVVIRECLFRSAIGDGVRLLGEGTTWNRDVVVEYCRFHHCGRAGVSFQRFNRAVRIRQCEFVGGTDQQIDFEPTGVGFTAGSESTASVIAGGRFGDKDVDLRTFGLGEGDLLRVQEANQRVTITAIQAVGTALHLTVSPPIPAGLANQTILVFNNLEHEIVGNVLRDSSNVQVSIMTLSGAHRCLVAHNRLSGPLTGIHVSDTVIEHNQIETAPAYGSVAVNLSGGSDGVVFRGNLVRRVSNAAAGGTALQLIHHNGRRSVEAAIERNVIDTNAAVAINVESVQRIRVSGNRILKTPNAADPRDAAINIRSHKTLEGVAIDAIEVSGNHIVSGDDPWSIGIQLSARPAVLDAAAVADNVHSRSEVALVRNPI